MYHENELRKLYERIKAQYPQYELEFAGDRLTVTRLYGQAEVNQEGATLYVNGALYDQFTSEEADNLDDLYELLELFFLELQNLGMRCGNETYIAAQKKASQRGTRFMLLVSVLVTVCMIALLVTRHWQWMIPVFVLPAAAFVPLALIHRHAFRTTWLCPACGQPLPLAGKSRFPQMEYVPQCPHCGQILEQAPELEPLHLEEDAPNKPLAPALALPAPGKKWPCLTAGGITIAISLFLLPLLFVSDEPLDPLGIAAAVLLLMGLLGLGLILLLRRHTEPEKTRQPLVIVRERIFVTVLGMILWFLSFVMMILSVIVAGTPPFEPACVFVLLAIGLPFMLLGIWMLLAGRNRTLFVFCDHSLLYISSWGKRKEFAPGQVVSVRLTASRSIHLLDRNGKKLVSVETNMRGIPRLAEWIESADLTAVLTPAMEKQAQQEARTEGTVQWREEYRTHWHDHIKTIRLGMWLVLVFFAIGTIAPIPLTLFAGIKFRTVMAAAAICPIPFLVFCLVFAPVLLLDDQPQHATPEWRAMHIKLPLIPVLLLSLLYMGQVHYFWDDWVLQEAGSGWLYLVRILFIGTLLTVLMIMRTPKRLRLGAGLFMGMIGFCFALGFHYYINTALCGPARHYPAVISDSHAKDPDDEEDHFTLTVIMDDGREADIAVTEKIYKQAVSGEPLETCHWESPLGVDFLDIHAPKQK